MTVSVIIPSYNRGYIIADAVRSVLNQTFRDLEIIVVDDGSSDNTEGVVSQFSDNRLVYIRHDNNKGVSTARNTGFASSGGEFICFLDSDDLWKAEMLEVQSTFLARHPNVHAVFTDLEKIHGGLLIPSVVRTHPVFSKALVGGPYPDGILLTQREMYLCLQQEMPAKIQTLMFRRACLEDIGGFDESALSGEDWDLLLRFARRYRFGFIDRPLATQRILADSTLATHHIEDATFLIERFIREKRNLSDDGEARACLRCGIAQHSLRLGWSYLAEGQTLNATGAYLKGFIESRDTRLLARALATSLPLRLRSFLKRLSRNKTV